MEAKNVNAVLIADVIAANTYDIPVKIVVEGVIDVNVPTQNTLITGTGTLSRNVTIRFDTGFTPKNGWSGIINWRTTLTVSGHTLTIQSTDVTTLVTGAQSIDFNVIYLNGAWEVTNIVSEVNALIAAYVPPVISVAGKTGVVTLVKADVGLDNVDNTSDANKPVSSAQATAISTAQSAATAVGNAAQATANTADTNATSALSKFTELTALVQVASWAAGPQAVVPSTNFYYLNIAALNGNVTLNFTPLSNTLPVSEITIFLGFTGTYTVTAGTNSVFGTITGSAAVVQTLTLAWNGTTYYQK